MLTLVHLLDSMPLYLVLYRASRRDERLLDEDREREYAAALAAMDPRDRERYEREYARAYPAYARG